MFVNYMTSAQRLALYSNLKPEGTFNEPKRLEVINGTIKFENV